MDPELVCQICSTEATGNTKFYHHYGAICCYRCKAFFRRCSRGETVFGACKNNGKCDLDKGRKTCKQCRYQKCLNVGMTPEKLLYGDDRKKYTHPKKRKKNESSANGGGSTGSPEEEDSLGMENPNELNEVQEPVIKRVFVDPTIMIQNLQQHFRETISEYNHNKMDINLLVCGQLETIQWSAYHSAAFVRVMEANIGFMEHFASKSKSFQSLNSTDQQLLLSNNSKLFREYMTTRYLASDTGIDQLEWILGLYESVGILDLENIKLVDFDLINGQCEALVPCNNTSVINNFKYCLEVIKKFFQYPHFHTALICNFILFNTKYWKVEDLHCLSDSGKIAAFELEARELIKFGCDEIVPDIGVAYLDQLIQTLFAMATIKKESPKVLKNINSKFFTQDESNWIKNSIAIFKESIFELPCDSTYVDTFLAFHSGALHLGPKFIFESSNMGAKRLRHFIKKAFGISTGIPPETLAKVNILVASHIDKYTTLGEAMKMYTGIGHFGENETRWMTKPNKLLFQNRAFRKFIDPQVLDNYDRIYNLVGAFLQRFEMLFLVVLDNIFVDLKDYGDLSTALRRLIVKKISESCVIETTRHPYDIYQQFLKDFAFMSMLQHKLLMTMLTNPSGEAQEQNIPS